MLLVHLHPGLREGKYARLRPMRGDDESSVDDGSSPFGGAALIDRLLVDEPGTSVRPGMARELAVCDRDRLLAAIYREYFGDQVEGTSACRNCGESFEVSFSLRGLLAGLERGGAPNATGPDADGIYTLKDGRRFRLPTTGDQQSVFGLEGAAGTAALLKRCVLTGDPEDNPDILTGAMAAAGPVLDVDVEAKCPDCGTSQSVRFDLQRHLLRSLAHEKRFLVREVHLIATVYGWGHGEILGLSRQERRAFAGLILAERTTHRRGAGR